MNGRARAEETRASAQPQTSPARRCPAGRVPEERGGEATAPKRSPSTAPPTGAGPGLKFCFRHFRARRRPAPSLSLPLAPGPDTFAPSSSGAWDGRCPRADRPTGQGGPANPLAGTSSRYLRSPHTPTLRTAAPGGLGAAATRDSL